MGILAHRSVPRALVAAVSLLVVSAGAARSLSAQSGTPQPARGTIAGAVIDAETRGPLPGAIVVLTPEPLGLFPGGPASADLATATRTALTDSAGRYSFPELPAGAYRLVVTRLSYRPYAIGLEISAGRHASLSLGLLREPIALEPVDARVSHGQPYLDAEDSLEGPPLGSRRVAARLATAERLLTTDARELTDADAAEAITLGSSDVFRALQRLPGVSTRSDYTAELWTRGGPWSHTAVLWDGVPLVNPVHALGLISGVSGGALGAVWFQPGTRSAALGGGAAGVVELASRRATGDGALHVRGNASLAGIGAVLDQRALDGRAGWLLSGRVSTTDWLADLVSRAEPGRERAFPYGFGEVAGNVDVATGERSEIEASWLWERDRLSSTSALDSVDARWGNALGRVTFRTPVAGTVAEHTLSTSRHDAEVGEHGSTLQALVPPPISETGVAIHSFRGIWSQDEPGPAGASWRLGYGFDEHRASFAGPAPVAFPRPTAIAELDEAGGVLPARSWQQSLSVLAVWGERTWTADRASARIGLRAEAGDRIRDGQPLRFAPRVAARFVPIPEVALSAGAARTWQYGQTVAPGGIQYASLVSTDAWVLAGRSFPALRSDIGTAGIEAWLTPGRVVTINGYARWTNGHVMPDPTPGPVAQRLVLRTATGTASGVEFSLRQLTGPVTGSLSYALSRSRNRLGGLSFRAAADRPHVLDATLMARLSDGLSAGAALTVASGVPYTPIVADTASCAATPGCAANALPWIGEPHVLRGPTFASLDLVLDYALRLGAWELGAYGQLRNALDRDNATVYAGSGEGCRFVGCTGLDVRSIDERGLPRMPVVGIRFRR